MPAVPPTPGALLHVPYPRPTRLSDPGGDFTASWLARLLRPADRDLTWYEFSLLFAVGLPAGTYEESVYFLPFAFDYLARAGSEADSMVTPLVCFVSKNADRLRSDGLLDGVRAALRICLDHWTTGFRVIHYDTPACRAKGWGLSYFDRVEHSETVVDVTAGLVDYGVHEEVAVGFVRGLAAAVDESDSGASSSAMVFRVAWFLEYASCRMHPVTPTPEIPAITGLITDHERLRRAAVLVRSSRLFAETASPTYWPDIFELFGV